MDFYIFFVFLKNREGIIFLKKKLWIYIQMYISRAIFDIEYKLYKSELLDQLDYVVFPFKIM